MSWKNKNSFEWTSQELEDWIKYRDNKLKLEVLGKSVLFAFIFIAFLFWYYVVFIQPFN